MRQLPNLSSVHPFRAVDLRPFVTNYDQSGGLSGLTNLPTPLTVPAEYVFGPETRRELMNSGTNIASNRSKPFSKHERNYRVRFKLKSNKSQLSVANFHL